MAASPRTTVMEMTSQDGSAGRPGAPAGDGRDGLVYPNNRRPTIERRRLPARTCCLAVVLTSLSVTLLWCSFYLYGSGRDGGTELLALAALTGIPGFYALWNLVGIKMRWPGYDNLAIFSDDVDLV